jgi:hypothetical protein
MHLRGYDRRIRKLAEQPLEIHEKEVPLSISLFTANPTWTALD